MTKVYTASVQNQRTWKRVPDALPLIVNNYLVYTICQTFTTVLKYTCILIFKYNNGIVLGFQMRFSLHIRLLPESTYWRFGLSNVIFFFLHSNGIYHLLWRHISSIQKLSIKWFQYLVNASMKSVLVNIKEKWLVIT